MTTQDLRHGLKACARCSRWQEPEAFPPNERLSSGLASWCRACRRRYWREWREANPERVEAYNAARRLPALPARACEGCGEEFTPRRRDQRRCRKGCGR